MKLTAQDIRARLSDWQQHVLCALVRASRLNMEFPRAPGMGEGWCTPLDLGGRSGTRHSNALTELVKKELVERISVPQPFARANPDGRKRTTWWYRPTARGLAVYKAIKAANRGLLQAAQEEK